MILDHDDALLLNLMQVSHLDQWWPRSPKQYRGTLINRFDQRGRGSDLKPTHQAFLRILFERLTATWA
jgi:hypothetical protein